MNWLYERIHRRMRRLVRSKNRQWTKSLLLRIIPISLLAIVPASLVFAQLYSDIRDNYIHESISSLRAQTTYSRETLELELNNIRSQTFELWIDRDVLQLATGSSIMHQIEIVERVLRIQNRLLAIKRSSGLIEDASIYFVESGRFISSSSEAVIDEHTLLAQVKEQRALMKDIISNEDGLQILQSYPSLLTEKTSLQAVLIINIPVNELRNHLSLQLFSETDTLYLTDANGQPYERTIVGGIKGQSDETMLDDLSLTGLLDTQQRSYTDEDNMLVAAYSSLLDSWIVKKTAIVESYTNTTFTSSTIIAFIIITILVISISFTVMFYFFYRPLRSLHTAFWDLAQGDFDVRIEHKETDSFVTIYRGFNNMSNELKNLVSQVYEQEILTQRAEMKHLQAQINPHFLYNSLFMLKTLLQVEQHDLAIKSLDQLGRYYQFLARDGRSQITLKEEVEHARMYTEIQQVRNAGRITICFAELPETIETVVVPRLILQPLIENAFEHGLKDVEDDGELRVSFDVGEEHFDISISNNGAMMNPEEIAALNAYVVQGGSGEITALQNILNRIKRYFGEDCQLWFQETGGFLQVILRIAKSVPKESDV